jgi:hypothetical protein
VSQHCVLLLEFCGCLLFYLRDRVSLPLTPVRLFDVRLLIIFIVLTIVGLLCDLLWSDPDKDIVGWGEVPPPPPLSPMELVTMRKNRASGNRVRMGDGSRSREENFRKLLSKLVWNFSS